MRRLLPYLALLFLTVFVAQPYWGSQLIAGYDGWVHMNRAVGLEHLLGQGHLFPRWMPHMAQGYGYPNFNYYAPLTAYLLVGLHQLGIIFPSAFHLALILSIWLAGVGAYWLARDWWGESGALVTGALYLTAPYAAFTTLTRGALAEAFGYACLPLVFFTLQRALAASRLSAARIAIWDLLSPVAFAALVLCHSPTSLLAAPFAAAYVWCVAWLEHDVRKIYRGAILLALGLGLSAIFWVPALFERQLVQLDRLRTIEPNTTYFTNFLNPLEIFALPTLVDPLLLHHVPIKTVGLMPLILAVVGVAIFVVKIRRPKSAGCASTGATKAPLLMFFLATGALCCTLSLSLARPVWDVIVLLQYFQYPWRYVGCATLCLSVVAGSAFEWKPFRAAWIPASVIAIAGLANVCWWYEFEPETEGFRELDIADTLRYETKTGFIGSTCYSEYLPVAVTEFPPESSVADALLTGKEPDYLRDLPPGSSFSVLSANPLNYRAAITLATSARITFNQFYFPGWRVLLDEQPVHIEPLPRSGLISFAAPAGLHTLQITFGDSFFRKLGNRLSVGTFLLLLAAAVSLLWKFVSAGAGEYKVSPVSGRATMAHEPSSLAVVAAAIVLNLLRFFVLDRVLVPTERDPQRRAASVAETPLFLNFTGGVRLHGYNVGADSISSGESTDVTLYFTAPHPLERNYQFALYLKDSEGFIWNNPNGKPTRWDAEPSGSKVWRADRYVKWPRRLEVFPDIPPGKYQLLGSVFDSEEKKPVSQLNVWGEEKGALFSLGNIMVKRPPGPRRAPSHLSGIELGPLTLINHSVDQTGVEAGNSVLLSFSWYIASELSQDYGMQLELSGPASISRDLEPVRGLPTSEWRAGDRWRGQYRLFLPASLPGGDYQLRARLKGQDASVVLSTLRVNAPHRSFTAPPPPEHPAHMEFPGIGSLTGYDIARERDAINLRFIWLATGTPDSSYKVFAHLADSKGRVYAQSDAVPAGWTRPTTGWQAGEYLEDRHILRLPPALPQGEYFLLVGLYDQDTLAGMCPLRTRCGEPLARLTIP